MTVLWLKLHSWSSCRLQTAISSVPCVCRTPAPAGCGDLCALRFWSRRTRCWTLWFVQNQRTVDTTYTNNRDSMLGYVYRAAFWTATKAEPEPVKWLGEGAVLNNIGHGMIEEGRKESNVRHTRPNSLCLMLCRLDGLNFCFGRCGPARKASSVPRAIPSPATTQRQDEPNLRYSVG